MVKHTQTIRRQFADECLDLFDHFVVLVRMRGNFAALCFETLI